MMLTVVSSMAEEAYAVIDDGGSLTFYYDNMKESRHGFKYEIPVTGTTPDWIRNHIPGPEYITVAIFDDSFAQFRPTSTYGWFSGCSNLKSVTGIENLHTEQVTTMNSMFAQCRSLASIDLSGFSTANVESMANMFAYCQSLTNIDVAGFNTDKVEIMTSMFEGCSQLESLNLSGFNTSSVKYMTYMFKGCSALMAIYVGDGWTTAQVEIAIEMFEGCSALTGCLGTAYEAAHTDVAYAHIDKADNKGYLSPFGSIPYLVYASDTKTLTFFFDSNRIAHVKNSEMLFYLNMTDQTPAWCDLPEASAVQHVVFDASFADFRPTTTYRWFYDCQQLEDFTGWENLNTSEVVSMKDMFAMLPLTELDLSHLDTRNVEDMTGMFASCTQLVTVKIGSSWSTEKVTQSDQMFFMCTSIRGCQGTKYDPTRIDATFARVDGGSDSPGYLSDDVMTYSILDEGTLTLYYDALRSQHATATSTTYELDINAASTPWNKNEVETIIFDKSFKSVQPTSINWFAHSPNLRQILEWDNLDTSQLTNMSYMFSQCSSLDIINLSSLNTTKVENINGMFSGCTQLRSVCLAGLDLKGVSSLEDLFNGCEHLESIDLSGAKLMHVTNMKRMFYRCKALQQIDLSTIFTEKVENMNMMFSDCESLKSLDVSTFRTDNVIDMDGMFARCRSLEKMDLRYFNTGNVTKMDYIFIDCTNLKAVNMSGLDMSKVENFEIPFDGCTALMSIDLSGVKSSTAMLHKNFAYTVPAKSLLYLPTGTELSDYGLSKHEAYNVVTDKDGDGYYTCEDFRMMDGIDYVITKSFIADVASFDRAFTAGRRSTIYLPFAFDATAFGTVYPFDGEMKEGNSGIRFYPFSYDYTLAHMPYIIDPNGKTITAVNVEVQTSRSTQVTGSNQMVGVCQTGYVPMGAYVYDAADGKLKRVARENGVTIRAGRAYFLLPDASSAAAVMTTFEQASGLTQPSAVVDDAVEGWFTLSGQHLQGRPSTKGIYIHQGRKTVVK